ncbi:DNA polymerase Y family protein [Streptomyces aureocirculatus]|uniref:DNA polymerase Y family protein n=1 Tax=Streptomyces aureocirculatus TaxID=67275 RepID=UPI0004C5C37E|nr:helix-hairpin-helix domain-containing protein [Streptomyces aureocirculatus]
MTRQRQILHVHFFLSGHAPDTYGEVLALLEDLTPRVMALPPDGADLDVTGALRFWDRDARRLGDLLRLRVAALFGIETTLAAAPNRMLATMAAAVTPPGQMTVISHDPASVRAFLRARPVGSLLGVGPATAKTLARHGLHTIGDLADAPPLALQRLLGAATSRTLHERAHGHDDRSVVTEPVACSASAEHRFDHDELDPVQHHRALLALAGQLGTRLRAGSQVADVVAITVRYADGTTTTRSRTLPEATHHTTALADVAYSLYAALGLQRARVRGITMRCEGLGPAEGASRQLSFDQSVDKRLLIEEVQDRARRRYGTDVIKPGALAAGW